LEDLKHLDRLIVQGYKAWVYKALAEWKADGFLQNYSSIVVMFFFD